jgi:hypothetical protein
VYQSQNNVESFDEYFKKSLAVDPKFPSTYFALYQYYADKNTETAKTNLDLFLWTGNPYEANIHVDRSATSTALIFGLVCSILQRYLIRLLTINYFYWKWSFYMGISTKT